MNILDVIVNAQDGAAVRQLGSQVGLPPDQTSAALSTLFANQPSMMPTET